MEYEDELILTYVPEAEYLTRESAVLLAHERDVEAAVELEISAMDVLYGEKHV